MASGATRGSFAIPLKGDELLPGRAMIQERRKLIILGMVVAEGTLYLNKTEDRMQSTWV